MMRSLFLSLFIVSLFISFTVNVYAQKVEEQAAQTPQPTTQKNTDSTTKPPNTKTPITKSITTPISINSLYKKDLQHYLAKNQLQQLLVGSDEIITLINEQTTANAKGVAILLPNWQQIATSPQAINYLREKLPQQGWTTITIQPPAKPDNYPSRKLNTTEQKEENNKALAHYKEKLAAILTKVMKQAANYPGIFLMIAEGSNAALLIELYQEKKLGHPATLIMLSAHLLTEYDNKQVANTLARLEIPILDLYLNRDNPQAIYSAPLRLAESKRQLKVYYQQKQLDNIYTGYYPKETLLTAINGWLKKIGW